MPNPPAWSHEQVEDAVRSRFPAAHLDLCFFRLTHEWEEVQGDPDFSDCWLVVLWLVRAPEAGEGTGFLKDSITERTRSELAGAVPRSERQWLEWFCVAAASYRLLIFPGDRDREQRLEVLAAELAGCLSIRRCFQCSSGCDDA